MEPVIAIRGPFTVLGVQTQITRGSETPELFAAIWKRFELHGREIEALSAQTHYFGVNFPTDKEEVTDYFAGMMVSIDSPIPEELQKRNVPGSRFAVFECPIEAIGSSYRYIFTQWLPRASVQFAPAVPVFEEYPGRSSPGPILIHIPLKDER